MWNGEVAVAIDMVSLWASLKSRARTLKHETTAIYLAARDPRTPWLAKVICALVAAYALSPIDLIPDFIPVLGYLDDLIIVPVGIFFALKLIPTEVMLDARARAHAMYADKRPRSWIAAALIVAVWIITCTLFGAWMYGAYFS